MSKRWKTLYKNREKVLLWIALPFFIIGLYALLIEPQKLRVTHWELQTSKLPADTEIRIVLLSDFHMINPWMTVSHVDKIVEKANALQPDYIFLLGDYVATHPFGLQLEPHNAVASLKSLKSSCGVFAVIGNHDYNPVSEWPAALEKTGIPVLKNRAVKSSCNGKDFWIAGLDDLWWRTADVQKTIEQITDESPVLLLMHNPDSFPEIPESVTASFAGHTHDGQIKFPFIGAVESVIPSQYGKLYAYGHIQDQEKNLFVTAGLGNSGIPLRLLNAPEIGLVSIKGATLGE